MNINQIQPKLKKKWYLVLAGGFVLILLLLFFLLLSAPKQEEAFKPNPQTRAPITPQTRFTSIPTIPPELQTAIDEAKQSSQEYDNWQGNLRTDYPWLRRLPFAGEKYYIYFDLNKKHFIGRLYPKASDNVNQMKTEIIKSLKKDKQIETEPYGFEWIINWRR